MTEIRSGLQYEFVIALSLVEKARYYAEASQQLSFHTLKSLLPVLRKNLDILKSVDLSDFTNDYFLMDLKFSLRLCIKSYERLIYVVETSMSDESIHKMFSCKNNPNTLTDLCRIMDRIWKDYWYNFHKSSNKKSLLHDIETDLVELYSDICLRGNERFENNYKCPSCKLNSAYHRTGITDECNEESIESQGNISSQTYCHHFVDIKDTAKFFNVDRIIFERRMNEEGTIQQ